MKNITQVIIGIIVITLGIFAYRIYSINKEIAVVAIPEATDVTQVDTQDLTKVALEKNQSLREGVRLIQENNLEAARVVLNQAVANETDPSVKSVADLTLAETYFRDNQPDLGAENMLRVGTDTSYPSSTRAFALLTIVQQYNGTKNVELLKVFGDVEKNSLPFIIEGAHRQIVQLHPMGLSVAYLATRDMARFSTEAKTIYDEAIIKIDNDIAFQNKGQGSNYIVPNTMIAKANLMARAEELGFATRIQVIEAYKQAITTAKEKLQTTTAQFAILAYMNYLGKNIVENQTLIDEALTIMEGEVLTEMVINHLDRTAVFTDWPGIFAIGQVNEAYLNYFSTYVPIPAQ